MTSNSETGQTSERRQQFEDRSSDFDAVVSRVATSLLDGTDPGSIQGELVDALARTGLYGGIWVGNRLDSAATRAVGADPLVEVLGEVATLPDDADGFIIRDGLKIAPAPVVQAIAADRGTDLSGVHAVRIPLRHRGLSCGMAVVATDRPDAFESIELEALSDIGRLAGFALDAIVQRRLLANHGAIEAVLEARHATTPTAMTRLARACEETIELDRVIPRDESAHLFLTVPASDCSPAPLEEDGLVQHATVRNRTAENSTVELVVSTTCPLASLAASGIAVVSAVADADRLRATIRAGETGPEILRAFRTEFPNVECVAKRQGASSDHQRTADTILEQAGLTRKQRTVLEAALAGGFFERPRERTGAEIAGSLDISASTFHQHLREAMRKVIETVIDPVA